MHLHSISVVKINEVERELIINNLLGETSFHDVLAYQDDMESCFEIKSYEEFCGAVDAKHLSEILASYIWDTVDRFVPITLEIGKDTFDYSNEASLALIFS